MSQVETDRATLRDEDGNLHEAVELTKMVEKPHVSGRTHSAPGTKSWFLVRNRRPLNTDDDQTFEDLDGRNYTRV